MLIPKVVLCMKWGTIYPAEYVNVLFHACQKNITGDFRFVCLTNEPEGIDSSVEIFPIPDIGLDEWHYYNGAWPKIAVFQKNLYELTGRCLFIDLDTVILGSLDSFFDMKGSLIAINNAPWSNANLPPRTMSSVFAFDLGTLGHVVDRLLSDRDTIVAKHKIEQQYLHDAVEGISYWPQDWLVSFKYHLRQPILLDRFLGPKYPPDAAKLIIFHGKPRPIDLVRSPVGNWDRFPHYGSGSVDWMRDYWKDNGGNV